METEANNIKRKIVALSVTTLLMTGCSKDVSDLHDFIQLTKSSTVGSVVPIKQFKPYESFSYSAGKLRDPFVPSVEIIEPTDIGKNSLHPETDRPKQHLETFPLDTLLMVGTLQQEGNSWGLINDPKNVVHKVKTGNYMGKNEGRITKITETKIHLVEIVPDGIGGYIERDASIAIGNE